MYYWFIFLFFSFDGIAHPISSHAPVHLKGDSTLKKREVFSSFSTKMDKKTKVKSHNTFESPPTASQIPDLPEDEGSAAEKNWDPLIAVDYINKNIFPRIKTYFWAPVGNFLTCRMECSESAGKIFALQLDRKSLLATRTIKPIDFTAPQKEIMYENFEKGIVKQNELLMEHYDSFFYASYLNGVLSQHDGFLVPIRTCFVWCPLAQTRRYICQFLGNVKSDFSLFIVIGALLRNWGGGKNVLSVTKFDQINTPEFIQYCKARLKSRDQFDKNMRKIKKIAYFLKKESHDSS